VSVIVPHPKQLAIEVYRPAGADLEAAANPSANAGESRDRGLADRSPIRANPGQAVTLISRILLTRNWQNANANVQQVQEVGAANRRWKARSVV
jgi:hypothetical protein